MKIKLLCTAAILGATSLTQAATVQVSTPPFNLASVGDGTVGSNGLSWGIIVDTANDGFQDFSMQAPGTLLASGFLGTDDYLFLSANPTTALGPSNGVVTSVVANFDDDAAVNGGQNYKVVWFEGVVAGGAIENGNLFGQSAGTGVLPAGNADLAQPNEFAGANGPAAGSFVVVPEPSVALLGALGIFGLVRRRR